MKILVLGLGNELLSDDGIGLLAVRILKKKYGKKIEAIECHQSGFYLIEYLIGFDRVIVIDAVITGKNLPGTITALSPFHLGQVISGSPHYAGFPELLDIVRQLNLKFPTEFTILAIEVVDPFTIGGKICQSVKKNLPELIRRVEMQMQIWQESE